MSKSIRVPITEEEHKKGLVEAPFERWLQEQGIPFHKQINLELLHLPLTGKTINYKADFVFKLDNIIHIVETKGYHQDYRAYDNKKWFIKEYALKRGAKFIEMNRHPKEYCLIEEKEFKEAKKHLLKKKTSIMSELYHAMKRTYTNGYLLDTDVELLERAKTNREWRLGKNGYIKNKAKLELFKASYDHLYKHLHQKKNSRVDYLARFKSYYADYKGKVD